MRITLSDSELSPVEQQALQALGFDLKTLEKNERNLYSIELPSHLTYKQNLGIFKLHTAVILQGDVEVISLKSTRDWSDNSTAFRILVKDKEEIAEKQQIANTITALFKALQAEPNSAKKLADFIQLSKVDSVKAHEYLSEEKNMEGIVSAIDHAEILINLTKANPYLTDTIITASSPSNRRKLVMLFETEDQFLKYLSAARGSVALFSYPPCHLEDSQNHGIIANLFKTPEAFNKLIKRDVVMAFSFANDRIPSLYTTAEQINEFKKVCAEVSDYFQFKKKELSFYYSVINSVINKKLDTVVTNDVDPQQNTFSRRSFN
jgi:hypothetical protein